MFRIGQFGLNPVEKGQSKDTLSQTTVNFQLTECRTDSAFWMMCGPQETPRLQGPGGFPNALLCSAAVNRAQRAEFLQSLAWLCLEEKVGT